MSLAALLTAFALTQSTPAATPPSVTPAAALEAALAVELAVPRASLEVRRGAWAALQSVSQQAVDAAPATAGESRRAALLGVARAELELSRLERVGPAMRRLQHLRSLLGEGEPVSAQERALLGAALLSLPAPAGGDPVHGIALLASATPEVPWAAVELAGRGGVLLQDRAWFRAWLLRLRRPTDTEPSAEERLARLRARGLARRGFLFFDR